MIHNDDRFFVAHYDPAKSALHAESLWAGATNFFTSFTASYLLHLHGVCYRDTAMYTWFASVPTISRGSSFSNQVLNTLLQNRASMLSNGSTPFMIYKKAFLTLRRCARIIRHNQTSISCLTHCNNLLQSDSIACMSDEYKVWQRVNAVYSLGPPHFSLKGIVTLLLLSRQLILRKPGINGLISLSPYTQVWRLLCMQNHYKPYAGLPLIDPPIRYTPPLLKRQPPSSYSYLS